MRTILIIMILVISLSGCKNLTIQSNKNLDYSSIDKTKYSNNPGICNDTCFGDFNDLGRLKISRTLNIFISGANVDLNKDCCQWTFAEIVHNTDIQDSTLDQINTYLVDRFFKLPKDSAQFATDAIKKTVMVVCTDNLKGKIKIKIDPFDFGIYKKPKNWD